jgi:RIO kinase 1
LGSRRAWDFITGNKYTNDEASVRALLEEPHDPIDDAVFMASFIPRSLGEVYDPERDVELVNAGRGDELIYAEMAGLDVKEKQEIAEPEVEEGDVGDEDAEVSFVQIKLNSG